VTKARTKARRHKPRYPVRGAEQAPAQTTLRVRTRLKVSRQDEAVLSALGRHMASLAGKDLAGRCKAGTSHDKKVWANRKKGLTSKSSSRWAGRLTKASNDAYNLARRNQTRALADKQKAADVISAKLALPVHNQAEREALRAAEAERAKAEGRGPRKLTFGYRSTHEHAVKRQRLQHLRSEVARLQRDIESGTVHICRGGKAMMRKRLHLREAGLDEATWRAEWRAKRGSFGANGEAGKRFGNETLRVFPDGTVEVDLPKPLDRLANVTTRGVARYRLDAKAHFSYRADEWLAQVEAGRAVAYDVVFGANARVYLDASFTQANPPEVPTLATLLADGDLRVLGTDLNHGFIAPAVLDRSGNLLRRLAHVPLVTEDLPASVRDGHLRQALTEVLDLAEVHGCCMVAIEDLGFAEMRATGRERYGSKKWFRKIVCGIPTAQFRDRLVAMAHRRGLAVVGVPAAYSSVWGAEYWQVPLSSKRHQVSRHTAAAVVLGRRALGHRAQRRAQASPGVTAPDRRIEAAGQLAGAESYHVQNANRQVHESEGATRPPRREGAERNRATRPSQAQVRPEAANVVPVVPRPSKTVRLGRVSLIGTQ
jgi:hypothetical protein